MKYELGVLERLKLLEILPAQGDISTIKIVRELRESLSFKEDEHVQFGIITKEPGKCLDCGYEGDADTDNSCPICHGGKFKKSGQQMIHWNIESARDVEIELGAKAVGVIVATLDKLSKAGNATEQHIGLFNKFVGD